MGRWRRREPHSPVAASVSSVSVRKAESRVLKSGMASLPKQLDKAPRSHGSGGLCVRGRKGCQRISRCKVPPTDRRPGRPLYGLSYWKGLPPVRWKGTPGTAFPSLAGGEESKNGGMTSQQSGCARKSATSRRRGMELAAPLTETARAEAAEAQRRAS